MKKRYFYNSMLSALAMLILVGMSSEVFGQNFENLTSGRVVNSGCFKLLENNAELIQDDNSLESDVIFDNSSGTITFLGTINSAGFTGANPLGESHAERIGGTVRFGETSTNVNQMVSGLGADVPIYYTNLLVEGSGGTKWLSDGIHVGGDYDNYWETSSASRSYTGTFYYDGGTQILRPEYSGVGGNTNRYANIDLSVNADFSDANNYKTLENHSGADGQTSVMGDVTSDANTNIRFFDDIYINHEPAYGSGSTIAGTVVVGQLGEVGNVFMGDGDYGFSNTVDIDNGLFDLTSTGSSSFSAAVAINSGSFSVSDAGHATFADAIDVNAGGALVSQNGATGDIDVNGDLTIANDATALLTLGTNTEMMITGTFVNNNLAKTNMTFGNGSNVIYDAVGAQTVVSTASSNPYANLYVEGGGQKTLEAAASGTGFAYVGETFNIGTYAGTAGITQNGSGTFTFADLATDALVLTNGAANYLDASGVEGKFRRQSIATAPLSASTTLYVYNNSGTSLEFGAAPANGEWMQLDVRSNTPPSPAYITAPTAPVTDVRRLFVLNSSVDDAIDIRLLNLAYLDSEFSGDEGLMRSIEGTGPGDDRMEKLHMRSGYTQVDNAVGPWDVFTLNANALNYHPLTMVADADARLSFQNVGQGSAIALTDEENYIITVADGRWSDDDTWDEGRPPYTDEVSIVRHLVYTGYATGPFSTDAETRDEADVPDRDGNPRGVEANGTILLAKSVTVTRNDYPGANGSNSAVVFFNNDDTGSNPEEAIYTFGPAGGLRYGVYNENDQNVAVWDRNFSSYANLNGLYIDAPDASNTDRTSTLRGSQITNEGQVVNNGCIEVGE